MFKISYLCKKLHSMKLSELKIGESGYIAKISGANAFRKRIAEMGFISGQQITAQFSSPLADPTTYKIMGYDVALRRSEAELIEITAERSESIAQVVCPTSIGCTKSTCCHRARGERKRGGGRELNVVLVGNPNAGKTTLFNALSGGHERVGNYSGVTVSEKVGQLEYQGYKINIIDLPGTYSLSAFSPEERYVQHYLLDIIPDMVVNVIAASNLERNLLLTTQLMDLDLPMVGALNMYDELEQSGMSLDVSTLAQGVGMPLVAMSAKHNRGVRTLLDEIIKEYERSERKYPLNHVVYGQSTEDALCGMLSDMDVNMLPPQFPARYWISSLLQGNSEALGHLEGVEILPQIKEMASQARAKIFESEHESVESVMTSGRYDFISALLKQSLKQERSDLLTKNERIDRLVTHKYLGLPIFLLMMWITFSATFTLGAYPQEWIEMGIEWLSESLSANMADGMLRDLVIDGILAGVGGVLVFVPNIVILYLFIVLLEGSGYMARAAFIMDRIMSRAGLDGRSFIPMMMGFGCNVPAIMATRTIEDRKVRLITILTNPFISCSARLPVFVLLTGTFFPSHAGTVITAIYILGILFCVLTALVLQRFIKSSDENPFILELPPYRLPSLKALLSQLWIKCEHYLKRIGSVILIASIIIWALDTFPKAQGAAEQQSYLQMMGEAAEPIMEPLGLDWRANVALLSGVAAKELIVGTMGVLYGGGEEVGNETILNAFSLPAAVAFMLFILLYFPCIGTVAAIGGETDRPAKWMLFSIIYTTSLAWIVAWIGYHITALFI